MDNSDLPSGKIERNGIEATNEINQQKGPKRKARGMTAPASRQQSERTRGISTISTIRDSAVGSSDMEAAAARKRPQTVETERGRPQMAQILVFSISNLFDFILLLYFILYSPDLIFLDDKPMGARLILRFSDIPRANRATPAHP